MTDRFERVVNGALAGITGAACMNVLRMLAHRAGLIDEMVPQKVEEWTHRVTHVEPPGGPPGHRIFDQLLHFGYGAVWGALYAGVLARDSRMHAGRVVGFALGQWALADLVLFPLLKIARPAWRARPREIGVNVGAHLLYAAVTGLLTEELARQVDHRPANEPRLRSSLVG